MSHDHFDPATYREWVRQEIPHYDHLQESIAVVVGVDESAGPDAPSAGATGHAH